MDYCFIPGTRTRARDQENTHPCQCCCGYRHSVESGTVSSRQQTAAKQLELSPPIVEVKVIMLHNNSGVALIPKQYHTADVYLLVVPFVVKILELPYFQSGLKVEFHHLCQIYMTFRLVSSFGVHDSTWKVFVVHARVANIQAASNRGGPSLSRYLYCINLTWSYTSQATCGYSVQPGAKLHKKVLINCHSNNACNGLAFACS